MDYLSVEDQNALRQRYRTTLIVVLAFCFSVLVYLLLAKIIKPGEPVPGSESWMQPVYSAAIVLGLVVVALRRIMLSNLFMRQATARGVAAVLGNLQTLTLICCALAELAAVGGLILYKMTGDYQYSWRLGVVSLFLLVYSFPRRGEWERAVIEGAKNKGSQPQGAKPA